MIQINKLGDQPIRLSSYFQKFENFTTEDLKDYKTFHNYVKIEVDILMYILDVKEFYINRNRKRTARNHYCIKCNMITNEHYVRKHVNDKHAKDLNNASITINDAIKKLGEVSVNTCFENKIMMNVFDRIYTIYCTVDKKQFETKLLNDVTKDEKIKNGIKQLLIKFVILSGYNYDDSV